MKTSLAQQQCSGRGRRPLGQQDDRIAIAVWELLMLMLVALNSGLRCDVRFAIASEADPSCLGGARVWAGHRRCDCGACRSIGTTASQAIQRLMNYEIGGTMSSMRVVQVSRPNGPFELVERKIPEPGAGSVRIKVEACGICHSDSLIKEGLWPGIQYPRVPGHEVAGIIDAVGTGVAGWAPGPAGRSRLARWTLRVLRFLPSR